jgi:DUF4097 and DUF4098 domain-containing protein YvlB
MNLPADRTLSIRFGLFLACSTLMALCCAPRADAEEWTKSYTIATRAQVRVSADDASVRISTGDTQQIDIRVEYSGYKLDKDLRLEGRQNGDRIELTARSISHWNFSWGKNSHSIRVDIHMPQNADLQVESSDGSVETDALRGNVDIRTGDGHITLNGVKGDIRLRTGDGHIEGRDLDGKLDATSGDGHMNIEGRFDSLNLRTGDGSISARAQNGSKIASGWNVHTGDGSVDLLVPGDLQANIDASTSDGHISLGIPVTVEGTFSTSQIHGKMNGGGQPLLIQTGDGSIRLSKS